MVELSNERLDKILHEETPKKEEPTAILRSVYIRYMRLYEKYFADISALNEDVIAGFREYQKETESLVKYYFMDIPEDVCTKLHTFDEECGAKLLGLRWHEHLFDAYEEFREKSNIRDISEKSLRAEFSKQALAGFYDAMETVFRDGFGTHSQTVKDVVSGIAGMLFGTKEKK